MNLITCQHNFVVKKEKISTSQSFLGTIKRKKIIEMQCSKCGRISFTEVPAGDDE